MRLQFDTIGATADVLQDARGVIPVSGVYRTAYGAEITSLSTAAAGNVLGARAVKTDAGAVKVFVGSAAKIEEATGSGMTDRSKAGGYSTGTNRWWFSQGITTSQVIATNYADAIQVSTGGAFSDLAASAPKAKIIIAQSNALLALNYNDGTAVGNGVWASDRGAATTWTPATGNDAAKLRLVESPGDIVAGAAMQDIVVVWKRGSMYAGRFVGGDEKWQFNMVSPFVGCFGIEAWVNTPSGLIFTGPAGTYLYDGSVPIEIDQGVRQLILYYIDSQNNWGTGVKMSHDEFSSCVFIWVPRTGTDGDNFWCFAYNYREKRWSQPYPMIDTVTDTKYDFGVTGVSDVQAVVRDLNVLDFSLISGVSAPGFGVGHYIVASDKKVYNLADSSYDEFTFKIVGSIKSGRFKLESPANTDLTLRRIYPIFATGGIEAGGSDAGLPDDTMRCEVGVYDVEHYTRTAPSSTVTATWDATNNRFDVFATGKVFDVTISGVPGTQFAVRDLRFDVVPVGKT